MTGVERQLVANMNCDFGLAWTLNVTSFWQHPSLTP